MSQDNLKFYLQQPIFLHAINRELHDALGKEVDPAEILHSIRVISILSCQTLFCNASQVYEVFHGHPVALTELSELSRVDRFMAHSDFGSLSEFLESRREIFAHSREKHPAFFEKPSPELMRLPHTSMGVDAATTTHIEHEIRHWIEGSKESSLDVSLTQNDKKILRKAEDWLDYTLRQREQQALTFDLFEQTAQSEFSRKDEGAIRRALTEAYIDNYLRHFVRIVYGVTEGLIISKSLTC